MDDTPRFRIQAVAEATGVNAPTLRAWERRYGFPQPTRAGNAYRLYSQADIERVRRMQALCADGLSAAEAAEAVINAPPPETQAAPEAAPRGDRDQVLADRIVSAAEALDLPRLESTIRHAAAFDSGWRIYERIFAPSLRRIGERWAAGALSVGHEHVASALIEHDLRDLVRTVQPPRSDRVALLACVAQEQHMIPLYGLALLAAHLGWQVTVAGARTPPEALTALVAHLEPRAVVLSVVADDARPEPRQVAEYGRACGGTRWIMGGPASGALRPRIEAAGGTWGGSDPEALRRFLLA